jgi:hypothetical protein
VLVDDRDRTLTIEQQPALRQFVLEAGQVRRFEQSRPERAMNFNRGFNDSARNGVVRNIGQHARLRSKRRAAQKQA